MSDQNHPPRQPGATGGSQHPQNPYGSGQYGGPQQNGPQPTGPQGGPQTGPAQGQNLWPQSGQPGYQQGPPQQGGQQYGGQPGGPQYGAPLTGQQSGGQPGGPQYGGQPGGPQYGGQPGGPQYGPGGTSYGQPGQSSYEQMHVGGQPEWQPEQTKKRGKVIPIIAAVAMVLVVAGGGIFAYGKLAGGKQPAAVLPGTAVAYARIDLNPSAGQKVAAIRFMMKFPSVKENLGLTGDKDDLRQKLFEQIKKSAGDDLADVNYDTDIKPWLGERAGIAALPPAGDKDAPVVVVAVQVKNEDQANKGLDKLFANEDKKPGRAFSNGYVLISEDQAAVDSAVSVAKENPLENNTKFKAAMDKLGEQGVASAWAEGKGLASLYGQFSPELTGNVNDASVAMAVRFDASYVEMKGVVQGDQSIKIGSADASDLITKLPDSTAAAVAVSGGENLVDTMWAQLGKMSDGNLKEMTQQITAETGLNLPDDLKTLLGKNLAVALDKDSTNGPKIAARLETDPAKAEPVVEKLTTLLQESGQANIPIESAKDNDTLVLATSKDYADQVLKGGNLGQTESFKQALPDIKGALAVGYVDFEAANALSPKLGQNKDVAALRSAGVVSRSTGDGEGEFSIRVIAK